MQTLWAADLGDGWDSHAQDAHAADALVLGCIPGARPTAPGISALQLQRQLGIARYETAWLMLQKLRLAMVAPSASR